MHILTREIFAAHSILSIFDKKWQKPIAKFNVFFVQFFLEWVCEKRYTVGQQIGALPLVQAAYRQEE